MGLPAALLFDLDGCLIDSFPIIARCWAETLAAFGASPPAPAEVRELLGPPASDVARHFAPDADEATIEEIVADYRRRSTHAMDVPAFDGIPELVAELAERGVKLGVATSKSIEVAIPLLKRLGLSRSFAVVEGTRVDELGADKATVVGRALDRLAPVRPSALIGDRSEDVRGAHAHGLKAIGALWGYGSREELIEAGVDQLAECPREVSRLVTGSL